MLTFKKLKEKYGLFTNDQLQLALKSTLEDGISIRKAAKEFHVPKSTLADYIGQAKISGKKSVPKISMKTMQED